ncbi:MAG: RidA family protein [Roseococcus sp.]|nr:RidA family protein [Roseococcus sp.]
MITRIPGKVASRSRAVIHNGIVTTVATSPVKSASMLEQAREALAAIDRNLADAGSGKAKIITAMVYLADMSRKNELNQAWDEWVDLSNPPQRACLGVVLEGADLVEIVVTAAV